MSVFSAGLLDLPQAPSLSLWIRQQKPEFCSAFQYFRQNHAHSRQLGQSYPDTADLPALLRQIYDVLAHAVAAVCVSHRYLAAADTPEERRPSRLFLPRISHKSSLSALRSRGEFYQVFDPIDGQDSV